MFSPVACSTQFLVGCNNSITPVTDIQGKLNILSFYQIKIHTSRGQVQMLFFIFLNKYLHFYLSFLVTCQSKGQKVNCIPNSLFPIPFLSSKHYFLFYYAHNIISTDTQYSSFRHTSSPSSHTTEITLVTFLFFCVCTSLPSPTILPVLATHPFLA